jgi:hypothetical protein
MPARRLGGTMVSIRRCDVAGLDAATNPEFIGHVGLASEERDQFGEADEIGLVHMMPPLERGGQGSRINCLGSVNLTIDEIRQIDVFADEVESEYEAARIRNDRSRQYVIAPHVRDMLAADGTTTCRQFNCAGFVIEAYREAGIDLLRTDPAALPPVSLDILMEQYPNVAPLLRNPRFRKRYGLEVPDDGPWHVVLAGYVVNALDRPEEEIRTRPHTAEAGDEFFPSRRGLHAGELPRLRL